MFIFLGLLFSTPVATMAYVHYRDEQQERERYNRHMDMLFDAAKRGDWEHAALIADYNGWKRTAEGARKSARERG